MPDKPSLICCILLCSLLSCVGHCVSKRSVGKESTGAAEHRSSCKEKSVCSGCNVPELTVFLLKEREEMTDKQVFVCILDISEK